MRFYANSPPQQNKTFQWQKKYVAIMMDIISRSLCSASKVDPEIQQELHGFPVGFCFRMNIFASKLAFKMRVDENHQLTILDDNEDSVDLTITFKHIQHAFLVFSFQESTVQAFANDRMIADGAIHHAVRLVRCLNRMEALILPKALALLATRSYPNNLSFKEKFSASRQIYWQVFRSYFSS